MKQIGLLINLPISDELARIPLNVAKRAAIFPRYPPSHSRAQASQMTMKTKRPDIPQYSAPGLQQFPSTSE